MVIFIRRGTKLNPSQIYLPKLISVERVLSSRGFCVSSEGSGLDTLLPKSIWTGEEADIIFEIYNDASNRRELLGFIEKNTSLTSHTVRKIQDLPEFKPSRQAYSHTFEWYVGELMVRAFNAFSSSYGVEVKTLMRPGVDLPTGDFDVLSIMGDTSLLYVECKTGHCRRDAIVRAVDRGRALHCAATIILLQVPVEIKSIRKRLDFEHPVLRRKQPPVIIGIRGETSSRIIKWGDVFFIDAGEAVGELEPKLRTALRLIAASRVEVMRDLALNDALCKALGYDVEEIA